MLNVTKKRKASSVARGAAARQKLNLVFVGLCLQRRVSIIFVRKNTQIIITTAQTTCPTYYYIISSVKILHLPIR